MLSVLSYNILFGKRVKEIIGWLASEPHNFDILCFQEFPKDKIRFLKKRLGIERYAYASNVIYKGRDYGQLTVIVNKKIQLVHSTEVLLGTNIFEDKILQLKGERSSLLTTLRFNKRDIFLANTHLIAYAFNARRRRQLAMLVDHLESVSTNQKRRPTLVIGDLNYSSLTLRGEFFSYMKKKGFINAHNEKTHNLLYVTYHQLDYIFYKHCQVTNVQILKQKFSDHYPMVFGLSV